MAWLTGTGKLLVAAVFRSDGSLVIVGVNGTAYIWDVTARQETSEMAAPRGHDYQRAAFSPDVDTMAAQDSRGARTVRLLGAS
jgi:hypothetical protein